MKKLEPGEIQFFVGEEWVCSMVPTERGFWTKLADANGFHQIRGNDIECRQWCNAVTMGYRLAKEKERKVKITRRNTPINGGWI